MPSYFLSVADNLYMYTRVEKRCYFIFKDSFPGNLLRVELIAIT